MQISAFYGIITEQNKKNIKGLRKKMPKIPTPLTDREIRALKPKDKNL